MPGAATILHADADAFYASVEQRDDPRLRGRPVIVGPGVVMAASYEAKAAGVRSGIGGGKARRLCPEAIFVPPRFHAYVEASRALFAVFERTAPRIEGLGLEEAFLDVTGLERIAGTPAQIGARLRDQVRRDVGLPLSVGIATSKVIAKMASKAAKPDGLLFIPPGEELVFLRPLPVEAVWGVGEATASRLREQGVRTVGEIADLPEPALIEIVGAAAGRRLHTLARRREWRPLSVRRRRSYGAQRALGLRRYRRDDVERTLDALADRVTRRMRRAHRVGRTVILRMRFGDYSRATRSRTLAEPTSETAAIRLAARELVAANRATIERRGLTMVGITVTSVEQDGGGVQLRLPIVRANAALDAALDELRDRFGSDAITRATNLDPRPELAADLLAGEE